GIEGSWCPCSPPFRCLQPSMGSSSDGGSAPSGTSSGYCASFFATPLTSWTCERLAAHHGEPCHACGHGTGRTYGGSRVDDHHGRRGYVHVLQKHHVADGSARTVRPCDPRQRCSGS